MNPVCEKFINIKLSGNIIPIQWYRAVKSESGKPDAIAVPILADIIYWYIPEEIRDEYTGAVTGYAQKFKTGKLKRTYQNYSDLFGFSLNQVRSAIGNLIRQGLITCEFGAASEEGIFLEPVFEMVMKITYLENKVLSPFLSDNRHNKDNQQKDEKTSHSHAEACEIVEDNNSSVSHQKKEEIVKKRIGWKDFENNWGVHLSLQAALKLLNPDELENLKTEYREQIKDYPNLLQLFDIEDISHTRFLFFCYSEKGIRGVKEGLAPDKP